MERNMHIIRASAGSGKTYTLARTFIVDLLGEPAGNGKFRLSKQRNTHQHILAITFTNMATDEMKRRIINQLHELSNGGGDYVKYIKDNFTDNFDDVVKAAQGAIADLLFDYSSFNVSTIDSFFQGVLRTFARELDRDYNYGIEIDEKFAMGVAVHEFLLSLGGANYKKSAVHKWVRDYVRERIANNESWNFFGNENDLITFSENINKEFFREHSSEIIEYLKPKSGGISHINRFRKSLKEAQERCKSELYGCSGELLNLFNSLNLRRNDISGTYKWLLLVYDSQIDTITDNQFSGSITNIITKGEEAFPTVIKGKAKQSLPADACDTFLALLKKMVAKRNVMLFLDDVLKKLWNLGLLGEINKQLEQFRKDTNSILIADTNELISTALSTGSEFIYEHVGYWFNHFMIDEFQDTSRKQYENFKPLLSNSLASGNSNLIIGDEKQSIYRFRNSDPALLREQVEKDYREYVKNEPLGTNYRSCPAIVGFNNELFGKVIGDFNKNMPQFTTLSETYRNISQDANRTSPEGCVTVNFVAYSRSDGEVKGAILNHLPKLINNLLDSGFKLSDIAVLVNTHSQGEDVVKTLMDYNENLPTNGSSGRRIDFMSQESLKLCNSPSVRLIIGMLQFIDATQFGTANADDDKLEESLRRYLRSQLEKQRGRKALYLFESELQKQSETKKSPGEMLVDSFKKIRSDEADATNLNEKISAYANATSKMMPDKERQLMSVFNIVDNILLDFHDASGGLEDAFVTAFQNEVLNFGQRSNGGTVREFLQYWELNKEKFSISSPSNANAVQIQTIHRSKGLEYNCVIVPFANWEIYKTSKVMWLNKSQWLHPDGKNEAFTGVGTDDNDCVPPLIPADTERLSRIPEFAAHYNKEREKDLIDNLNKTYVAFTRPKQELHIFAPISNKSIKEESDLPDITRVSQLLYREMSKVCHSEPDEWVIEGETDDAGQPIDIDDATMCTTYSFGMTSEEYAPEADNNDSRIVMPPYFVSKLLQGVRVSLPDNPRTLRDEGKIMHLLMSKIKDASYAESALAEVEYLQLLEGNVVWTLPRVREFVAKLMTDDVTERWFAPDNRSFNERTLLLPCDGTSENVHNRPDRVVITPDNEVIVVDYKFGKSHSKAATAQYVTQVRGYLAMLAEIFPNCSVEGYILYADNWKISAVDM